MSVWKADIDRGARGVHGESFDSASPYLSIVVTSRNDDHGGGLTHRMQLFVSSLLDQTRRYNLSSELIFVEWNPPPDRPRLIEALNWPEERGPCAVRFIEVPLDVHNRFQYADRLPLFQMIAKNAGVRRAQGRFVLATNIDILFSEELFGFLASGRLQEGVLYRVDRFDVPADTPLDLSTEERLAFCKNNVIRVYTRYEIVNYEPGFPGPIGRVYPFLTPRQQFKQRLWERVFPRRLRVRSDIHTNAPGDFTLMARRRWFDLRAYPELTVSATHIDSLLCYMAYHASIQEQALKPPMVIYHIDHSRRTGDSMRSPQETQLSGKIPRVSDEQLTAWALQMRRQRRPIIFNDENWGLAGEDLPETRL